MLTRVSRIPSDSRAVRARRFATFASVLALMAGSIASTPADAQPATPVTVDIPSQQLGTALTTFADQAGLRLLLPSGMVAGRSSPALSGTMTREAALTRLLAGTGLSWQFTQAGTVTITDGGSAPGAAIDGAGTTVLDTIQVSGPAGNPVDAPYETPGSSAYISEQQIQRLRGASPGDIFKGTPGVFASGKNNGAKLDVNIRGLQGQSRVKVAIDGTQQSTTTWRGYQGVDERVYIDTDLIGGIEIEKGPTGGAQGAGVTGGVVSIRTLNANDIVDDGKSFGLRLRASTSDNAASPQSAPAYDQRSDAPSFFDFENGSGSIALAMKHEAVDLIGAFSRRQTGNYFAGSKGDRTHYTYDGRQYPLSFTKPGEEVFNTSEDTASGLAKATFRLGDDHTLELGYVGFRSQFGESMGSLLFQQDDGYRQVELSDIRTDTYTGRYRWNPDSDIIDLRANLWLADVSGTTRAVGAFPNLIEWGIYPADEPRYSETRTIGGDITNTSRFDTGIGAFSLDYGVTYTLEDMDGDVYCSRTMMGTPCVWMTPSVGERGIGGVFSTAKWEVNDWLTFDGGLRYDVWRLHDRNEKAVVGEDKRDGGGLSPTVGVALSPLEGVQFFGRYAEGLRPPTMRETMVSDANATPNLLLEAERTKSWEIGANLLRSGVFSEQDKLALKFSYFNNDHHNYISRVSAPPVPGMPFFTFDNLDLVTFRGIELSGFYDAGPVFLNGALTYYTDVQFCRYGACGDNTIEQDYAVAHVPPDISISLTAGLRLFEEKLTVGGRVTHNGDRVLEISNSTDRQRTPMWLPYTTLDAFASYKLNDNFTVDVQAQNLFDLYYVDALDGWNPAPGRTVRASLTAKF
jgi:hemoglobin/transferrin/lactoferrin receptor protein